MKTYFTLFLLAVLHFFCFATVSMAENPYRLAAGDTLEIHVVGRDELTTKQAITPDGTLSVPMLGRLHVAGKTLFELDSIVEGGLAKVVKSPNVVTYLIPKTETVSDATLPIYVVIYDLKKETWDVKTAKSSQEALAWTAGKGFKINGSSFAKATADKPSPTQNVTLKPGDIVQSETGSKPDFWESNWYKVLTSLAVVTGIVKTLGN